MTILVSPAEREPLHQRLGNSSSIPEDFGADFFFVGHGGKSWGIQRKTFPEDLSASLSDGRFAKELNQMLLLDHPFFLFEGYRVIDNISRPNQGSRITEPQITAIELSLSCEGVGILWTKDKMSTAVRVRQVYDFAQKERDVSSLRRRPKGPRDDWGKFNKQLTQMWILESWPGISQVRAKAIIEHFGGLPLAWTKSQVEMLEVPGIGPKTVANMFDVLEDEDASDETEI